MNQTQLLNNCCNLEFYVVKFENLISKDEFLEVIKDTDFQISEKNKKLIYLSILNLNQNLYIVKKCNFQTKINLLKSIIQLNIDDISFKLSVLEKSRLIDNYVDNDRNVQIETINDEAERKSIKDTSDMMLKNIKWQKSYDSTKNFKNLGKNYQNLLSLKPNFNSIIKNLLIALNKRLTPYAYEIAENCCKHLINLEKK